MMLTDKTFAATTECVQYTSPEIREIHLRAGSSILTSSNEEYTNNNDPDWFN